MEIKIITDQNYQKIWDDFVINNSWPADFLQSWQWGEFKKNNQEKILRLAVYTETQLGAAVTNKDELIAVAQFIYQKLPLSRYFLFCPRGPVIKIQNQNPEIRNNEIQKVLKLIIEEIKKIAEKEKIVFARFELPEKINNELRIMNYGLKEPKILIHSKNPENTLLLDLAKSEEEILTAMHPKWRYNIRLAEKKKIKAKWQTSNGRSEIEEFYKLLQETAERDGIKIFSKKYYEELISYFNILQITDYKLQITLLFAEYNNKILSSILLLGFGDTLTYLHGGSSNKNREVMPNHALQWAAIKWAKKNGYKWYDFWGVNNGKWQKENEKGDKENKKNNWQGITRFKMGFVNEQTGQEINYVGARDFVVNKLWYNLYRMGRIIQF